MNQSKRILAIETSGRYGSGAILEGVGDEARLVKQVELTGEERTAQTLAPALQNLLKQSGWQPQSIQVVVVAVGPGSFTGLRIGVTTAKTLAYAIDADLVGVNTLDVLAAQAPVSASPLWTVLDAQRQELFAAKYLIDGEGKLRADRETSIIPQDAWLNQLQPGDHVTGVALKRLRDRLPSGVTALPQELWQTMAAAVGAVAWEAYRRGQRDDIWQLVPNYYRASAAEEKRVGAQDGRAK